jgi:hypothetical protein
LLLLCIKKDCQHNILHGILLAPAHGVPVGTHTCTMPPCRLVAIVIGPAWQRLNVATCGLTTSACCYCDIYVKNNMVRLLFTSIHKKILSTESSPPDHHSTRSSRQVGMGTCPQAPCCECKEKSGAGSYYTSLIKSYCCGYMKWST